MQRNQIQQGGHPPPRQQGNGRRPHVVNLPRGQNVAQIQGMNIPPEVQMNQRGIPRRNQDWRELGGAPQRPVHHGNRNIPFGHNIPQGPLRPTGAKPGSEASASHQYGTASGTTSSDAGIWTGASATKTSTKETAHSPISVTSKTWRRI